MRPSGSPQDLERRRLRALRLLGEGCSPVEVALLIAATTLSQQRCVTAQAQARGVCRLGALHVEAVLTAASQQVHADQIYDGPEDGNHQHDRGRNGDGRAQSFDCLIENVQRDRENEARVVGGGQDLESLIPEGAFAVCGAPADPDRHQRHRQRSHVGEHMRR